MGADSKIEWTDHTFNPWWGCTKVSPGCDHCYAEAWARRARVAWGPGQKRRYFGAAHWAEPLKWNAAAAKAGVRRRVFCASMADVFDNEVHMSWRDKLLRMIEHTPHLDWLLLTKRIGNVAKMVLPGWLANWPHNVWLGISVVNQEEADRDIPKLLTVPAAVRFLSCEPLLGAIDLTRISLLAKKPGSTRPGIHIDALRGRYCESGLRYAGQWDINGPAPPAGAAALKLDWAIVGGESGPGARPMHPAWARSLRDQCQAAGVPFFFKQWGHWKECELEGPHASLEHIFPNGTAMLPVGKKDAGRLLGGREWNEFPQVTQHQQAGERG